MKARAAVIAALAIVAGLLVTAGPVDAAVAVRQKFFGVENVAPDGTVRSDRVILSWFGVTNFAAAIGGHVVLLDAWVPRGEYSGYIPTTPMELATLDPEFIILGHGHFDHAADAAEIAVASGATAVGTAQHCDQLRQQAGLSPLSCLAVMAEDATFGTKVEASFLSGVGVSVVKHVHSAAEPPDPSDPHTPTTPPPDANATVFHLPAPQDTVHLVSHLGDAEGWSLLYQFRVGDFSLTWHDSAGPLKETAPGVFQVFRDLPATDVQLGAIMGFNQLTNGLRDPRMYIEALGPKIFVPQHHDNWAPGVSTRGENYEPFVREELARIPEADRPILRFISDPQDYVRPEVLTFDVNAPYWAT